MHRRADGRRREGTSDLAVAANGGNRKAIAKVAQKRKGGQTKLARNKEGQGLVAVRALQLYSFAEEMEDMYRPEAQRDDPSMFLVDPSVVTNMVEGFPSVTQNVVTGMLQTVGKQWACERRMFDTCFEALCKAKKIPEGNLNARVDLKRTLQLDFQPIDDDGDSFAANSFDMDTSGLKLGEPTGTGTGTGKGKGKRATGGRTSGRKRQRKTPEPDSDSESELLGEGEAEAAGEAGEGGEEGEEGDEE